MEKRAVINQGTEIIFVKAILQHLKGNKSPYFSITGEIWERNKRTGEKKGRDSVACGCIHDDILKAFPGLYDLIALHLSDIDGSPMHAVENGYYYLRQGKIDVLAKHLRIPYEEAEKLQDMTKEDFIKFVDFQRLRWKEEADKVIDKYNLQTLKG